MNIYLSIDEDGTVSISDLPEDLIGMVQELNPSYFHYKCVSHFGNTNDKLGSSKNIIKNEVKTKKCKK